MTTQMRTWLGMAGVLAIVLASAGWWVFQSVQSAAIVAKPPVTTTLSPLSSPVIEMLQNRQIVGSIPVIDPGPSHRSDPFSK